MHSTGEHHYTTNEDEKNYLSNSGWKYEGVGWYGYSGESEEDSQDTASDVNNKYEQLRDYVVANGILQDNEYYWLIKYDDNNTFGICYKTDEDALNSM